MNRFSRMSLVVAISGLLLATASPANAAFGAASGTTTAPLTATASVSTTDGASPMVLTWKVFETNTGSSLKRQSLMAKMKQTWPSTTRWKCASYTIQMCPESITRWQLWYADNNI